MLYLRQLIKNEMLSIPLFHKNNEKWKLKIADNKLHFKYSSLAGILNFFKNAHFLMCFRSNEINLPFYAYYI